MTNLLGRPLSARARGEIRSELRGISGNEVDDGADGDGADGYASGAIDR
jgi:hypothetical protein